MFIVARVLTAVGLGYNRLTARWRGDGPSGSTDPATAPAKLSDMLDRG